MSENGSSTNMLIRQVNRYSDFINVIFAYSINAVLITDFVNCICLIAGLPLALSSLVRNVGYATVVLYALYLVFKFSRLSYVIVFSFFVLAIVISELRFSLYSEGISLLSDYAFAFVRLIPSFIIAINVIELDRVVFHFKFYVGVALLYGVLNIAVLSELSTNYMTFSYNILFPALVAFLIFKRDNAVVYLGAAIILGAIMLLFGARGPLCCLIAGIVLITIAFLKDGVTYKIVLSICLAVIAVIILIYYMPGIIEYLYLRNPDSRTLGLLYNTHSITDFLTGRDALYSISVNAIKDHWLFGSGVFSSNVILCNYLGLSSFVEGVYPHNLFLDLFLQFGILFGTVAIILLFALLYIVWKDLKKDNRLYLAWFYILFSRSIISLLVSSTYIFEPTFWILIAYCIMLLYNCRDKLLTQDRDY